MVKKVEIAQTETNEFKSCFEHGKWICKNLEPLSEFIYATNQSTVKIAEKTGMSRQNIYASLSKDDMKLSSLERVFEAYGCKLEVKFEDDVITRTSIDNDAIIKAVGGNTGRVRLVFIYKEMTRQGLNKTTLANKMHANGCTYSRLTVNKWFNVDDCMMSQLHDMAKALGKELRFHIKKNC